jgi:pyruvate kinase
MSSKSETRTLPAGTPDAAATEAERVLHLLEQVTALRADVLAEAEPLFARWNARIENERFRPSALNLAYYLALRRRDVTRLQEELSPYGLSSLGRSAMRVRANLDALVVTLEVLAGRQPTLGRPAPDAHRAGVERARWRTERIFGAHPRDSSTRIMVTLSEELAGDVAACRALLEAGADVARLNGAHGDPQLWQELATAWRTAASELGRQAPVQMDIPGPKCRTTAILRGAGRRLEMGERLALLASSACPPGDVEAAATIEFPELLAQVALGHSIYYDDGKLGGTVVEAAPERVVLVVTGARKKGARLREDKGLNFPELELRLPVLSAADLPALDFAAEHADIVGLSFAQRPEDVVLLQSELRARMGERAPPPLVLKIETRLGVRNLPRLIVQAGALQPVAVMIARGDLAIELGFERLAEIQGEVLDLCRGAQVPVVWATQVLEGLVKNGWPSRAEATDASVGQLAECVMLNKGPHQAKAVRLLAGVLRRMERHRGRGGPRLAALHAWDGPQDLAGD